MDRQFLVFQSDYGREEGSVSQMYGVALQVDPDLRLFEITHEIPQFNIWEASYRLFQTINSWRSGTVFVSVVDPGVGSDRQAVVAKTLSGHYIATPNNGSLTHLDHFIGIESLRVIDESVNRRSGSEHTHTFNGRDIFGYTGARLASGVISFEEVGPLLHKRETITLPMSDPIIDKGIIKGYVEILDTHFGHLWTNITRDYFQKHGIEENDKVEVTIYHKEIPIYQRVIPYVRTFSSVPVGEELIYINELMNVSVGTHLGVFADEHVVGSGMEWIITFEKA